MAVTKFLKLSRAEKALLLQAAAWLVWIRFLLSVLAYRHVSSLVQRWASPRGRKPVVAPRPPPPAHRLGQLVAAAANRIPGTTCLPRALATQILLCRHGHAAQLRI